MTDAISFSSEGHIGFVTLQRAGALNALTLPMIMALQTQLQAWENDATIHAVVIQSSNEKAFCAGGDVRWLFDMGRHQNPQQMQFFSHEYRLNRHIHHFKKPYIPLMNGITMGGGVGISLHGSTPVATERFVFAMPETGIGFFPDVGASYLLSRCPGKVGIYLGLTGNRLGAVDARVLGLVKHVISSDALNPVVESLINADLSVNAQARVDECIQRFAMTDSVAPIIQLQTQIAECFGAADIEAIMQALSQGDDWHEKTLQCLSKKSPLSLKVTLAQLLKAASMTFDECVHMDSVLVGHFVQDSDFYEGVRALIIDKDNTPQWQPSTLLGVTDEQVDHYFTGGFRST